MRRILFIVLLMFVGSSLAFGEFYIVVDRGTGDPLGGVDVNDKALPDWTQKYIMIKADEKYREKKGYEIKYQAQSLRYATPEEIEQYELQKEQKTQNERLQEYLSWFDKQEVKDKIKEINKP